MILTLLSWYLYANNKRGMFEENAQAAEKQIARLKSFKSQIGTLEGEVAAAVASQDYLASVASSRNGYAEVLDAVRGAMLPDTMVQSLSFENADGRGETPPSMRLVVRGFTEELNSLSSAKSAAGKQRQSAGEILLSNLLKSPLFAKEPRKGFRSKVEKEGRLAENENLVEIPLTVYLARPLGVFSPAWIPSPEAPAAEEAEEEEPAEEDAPESEPEEEDAE